MKVFQYQMAQSKKTGLIIADDVAHARKRLDNIGIKNISALKISYIKTADILLSPRMSAEQRFHFFRTLYLQLQGDVSLKDSLSLMLITGYDVPTLKAVGTVLDAVNRGEFLSSGLKQAGFPEQEINTVVGGEGSGRLNDAIYANQQQLQLTIQIKKELQGALYGPAFSLFALWLVAFAAFAYLLPFIYDSIIGPTKAAKAMSSGMLAFFNFCLWVRDALPYSAVVYYGLPVFVWGGFHLMGYSLVDFIGSIGIIGKFRITLDILQALRIMIRNLEFRLSIVISATQVITSMKTAVMREGMISFVKKLRQGQTVGDAALLSSLPIEFSMELASAEKTKFFTERLKNYATIVEAEIKPMGEKVKFIVSLTVIVTVASTIGGLFIAVYLPVIKATLSLAG